MSEALRSPIRAFQILVAASLPGAAPDSGPVEEDYFALMGDGWAPGVRDPCLMGSRGLRPRNQGIHISLLPPSRVSTIEIHHRHMAAAKESEVHRMSGAYRE
eukprot:1181948-Prorocentrum_minimum.AAC.4